MTQRERLILLLESFENEYPKSFNSLYYVLAAEADFLIANGVVALPCRCGECKYFKKSTLIDGWTYCYRAEFDVSEEDFCSYGKRKGGDV